MLGECFGSPEAKGRGYLNVANMILVPFLHEASSLMETKCRQQGDEHLCVFKTSFACIQTTHACASLIKGITED